MPHFSFPPHPLLRILLLLALAGANTPRPACAGEPPRQPNILFILADDLGIDGVSCYGADQHQTPQIDRLAASGTRFETCYAAPLCGPSRCLLMTGRYAFRTGGLTNASWRNGGPGARSADEQSIPKLLHQAGYATGMAGKWRQMGETPRDWGFDEYTTDPTAAGWYWQTMHWKNGEVTNVPPGTYAPDVIQDFTVDFLRRHRQEPFFFYYAMHLVHKPTLHTPDSPPADGPERYADNIAYMDKQVGALMTELTRLGLREKTLVLFSGDNGTAAGYSSPVHGRLQNGAKGSLLEGGSRVPFIASWPGVTPAGKVSQDILSFADPHATFLELAGVKTPQGAKFDGHSFAPQLRGEKGDPRSWAYVQLGARWYVRERGWKLNQAGELFDMSDAPYVEKPVEAAAETAESKAARQRLGAALGELRPAAGKTDAEAGGGKNGPRKRRQAAEAAKALEAGKTPGQNPAEGAPPPP